MLMRFKKRINFLPVQTARSNSLHLPALWVRIALLRKFSLSWSPSAKNGNKLETYYLLFQSSRFDI